jgi:selenocysteine-specific elongation factor
MSELIVGLSGHIDHGKTSIIKSLTNEFSGTLKEDLKRGMTVDLGIAFLNDKITLIDVPGHQDFIKNMLSGIQSIDVGLLVVAADDGIMPQTIDHFNILKLLKVSKLIILINKIDLVDDEMIQLVKLEIEDLINGSKYQNSNIINISTIENKGIKELKETLENIKIIEKNNNGAFRMPIDRIFSVKGFGTVVTGTVTSGNISIGDEVNIEPISKSAKIRGINSHNSVSKTVSIGQRAAINLQNIDKEQLKRGFQVVDKFFFSEVYSIIAKIVIIDSIEKPIKRNQRIRVHLGTAEVIGKIFLFGKNNLKGGETAIVLINLEKPIVASYKDRFIIRNYSPVFTLGGGSIFIHSKIKNNFFNKNMKLSQISNLAGDIQNVDESNFIKYIIQKFNLNPILFSELCNQLGYSKLQLTNFLKSCNQIKEVNHLNKNWLLTEDQIQLLKSKVLDTLKFFFKNNPYSNSVNKEIITNDTNINSDFVDYLLIDLKNEKQIEKKLNGWALFKHEIKLSELDRKNKEILISILDKEGFNTSSIKDLIFKCNMKDEKTLINIIKICENKKLLVRVDQSILLSTSNFNNLKDKLIIFFKSKPSITVVEFKELLNISRKYAIPLLEYLDKIQFTYRDTNVRKLIK